ncbi:MAG: chorismate mutase [Bacteroidota bacterium]|nr:chorismate mutase [Bacteroidota bacterium]
MEIKLDIVPVKDWLGEFNKPLIISGPCSAETEEQTLSTARELAKNKEVKIFRAGIWKPRTRPNSFEGVGDMGLSWLRKVKEETGMLTATEVANGEHVDKAFKYGVDVIWIGARTATNPFSVQEIADSLRGRDIAVMVKNPVNPDLDLWIGALERINQAGIKKIVAIHRGFSSFTKGKYRNSPEWKLVIELKRLLPELPIISDPSHICGNKEYLKEISQNAIDLDLAGLMLESHINPKEALSDKNQQLTPAELKHMLCELIPRDENANNIDFDNKLDLLRNQIDKMDEELLEVLGQRMNIVREIADYKKKNKVTILQIKRWSEIINKRLSRGEALSLKPDFINIMFQLIHEESIIIQTELMNKS